MATQGQNAARPLYEIGALKAKARIALAEWQTRRRHRPPAPGRRQKEDRIFAYNEPSDEFFPVRHLLGAALLDARRAEEAEAVYREDLRRQPEQRLGPARARGRLWTAQGKRVEGLETGARFEDAWRHADTALTGSAF
jgi:hypothetical protein